MTISKQLIQLKQAVVNAAPEIHDVELLPTFQTMCEIMRSAFQYPHLYTDESAIIRHCLLQKEVADALTPDVILWLFNTHQGQSVMLTDSLRVHQILELGFPEGEEELIAALWHYSSEFDQSKQEIIIRQYEENTKRIIGAIEAATALFHQNSSKNNVTTHTSSRACEGSPGFSPRDPSQARDDVGHEQLRNNDFDDFDDCPESWSPLISVSPTLLRTGVLIGRLAEESGMSIMDLLKAHHISLEALYRHNGFRDMKEPKENLYIEDLAALYAEQQELDDLKPPPVLSNEVLPELRSHHYPPVFSKATLSRKNVIPGLLGKIVDVPGDGNCFFHAFALGLTQKNIASLSHEELRSQAVAYLRAHPALMHNHSYENEEPGNYLNRMSLTGIPAEGPIIEATAAMMNVELDMINIDTNLGGENTSARFVINAGVDRAGTVTLIRRQEARLEDPHPYQHYQVLEHTCTTRTSFSSTAAAALAPTAPRGPSRPHQVRFVPQPPESENSHSLLRPTH